MLDWPEREHYTAEDLIEILRILRDPETGCPWDRVQTHQSIRKNFLEETYEALEALDADDPAMLREDAYKEFAEKIQDMLDHLCGVLGVAEVAEEEVSDEDVAKIEALIAERTEAKKAKDFAKADAIRDELAAMGITIKDTRQGVQWFRG